MSTQLPITKDILKTVKKVAGFKPRHVFNDKRKTFERRYKLSGVYDVSQKKVQKIRKKLSKKYPTKQFVVKNSSLPKNAFRVSRYFGGLTISVY